MRVRDRGASAGARRRCGAVLLGAGLWPPAGMHWPLHHSSRRRAPRPLHELDISSAAAGVRGLFRRSTGSAMPWWYTAPRASGSGNHHPEADRGARLAGAARFPGHPVCIGAWRYAQAASPPPITPPAGKPTSSNSAAHVHLQDAGDYVSWTRSPPRLLESAAQSGRAVRADGLQ